MGMHPARGVPAGLANKAFQPKNLSGCDTYYPKNGYGVTIDTDAINAMISEVRQVIDAVGGYDCEATDNLVGALAKHVCRGLYEIGEAVPSPDLPNTTTTTITHPDGSTTICATTEIEAPCPAIYIHKATGAIYVYDREAETWKQAAVDIAFEAGAPTASTPTCKSFQFDTNARAFSVRNPVSEAWVGVNVGKQVFIGTSEETPYATALLWYQSDTGVLHAKVDGGQWAPISLEEAAPESPSLSGLAPQFLVQQTRSGYASPANLSASAWATRILNGVAINQIAGASLNDTTGVITLPAGTYRVKFIAMAFDAEHHRARLYNIDDSAVAINGVGADSYNAGGHPGLRVSNPSDGYGRMTIAATKTFRLEHYWTGTGGGKQGDSSAISGTHFDAFVSFIQEAAG